MTAIIEADGLGKRYGRKWALSECTLAIPAGKVVGLVGPNGAGKTTLLHLSVGLLQPSAGSISVLGGRPGTTPTQLGRVGFVAQDTPTRAGFSVADHLRFGRWMNPNFDVKLAEERIESLGLDPLARREFLQGVIAVVVDSGTSVILSSHLVADLERVCDYLVVVVDSRVQVAGEIDELLASHHRLTGPRHDRGALPRDQELIDERHTDRQSTLVVRTNEAILDPAWTIEQLNLEDLVLTYMTRAGTQDRRPKLEARS